MTTDHPLDPDFPDDPPPPGFVWPPWPVLAALAASWLMVICMLVTMFVISNTVRHNVREYLFRRGLLQEEIAKRLGMTQAEIDRIMAREEDRR